MYATMLTQQFLTAGPRHSSFAFNLTRFGLPLDGVSGRDSSGTFMYDSIYTERTAEIPGGEEGIRLATLPTFLPSQHRAGQLSEGICTPRTCDYVSNSRSPPANGPPTSVLAP